MSGAGAPWVAMRARNDMPLIGRTLAALALQDRPHRLLVLDNASSDGTREAAAKYADRVIDIPEGAYVPGRVLNMAMRETDGEFVVFLNSDCEPTDSAWLDRLLAAMGDPDTAAAFGRQDPRPDCDPLMAKDTLATFGDGAAQARWRHCFSMASSCVRRSAWEAMPFSETLRYSEDIDWTWRARLDGWRITYAPDSGVYHSHNYTLPQLRKRQYGEGYAEAEIFEWEPARSGVLRYSILPWGRLVLSDAAWALSRGKVGAALASPLTRGVMAAGRRAGFRDAMRDGLESGRRAAAEAARGNSGRPPAPRGSAAFNERLLAALDRAAEHLSEASGGALAGLVLCGGYGRGEGAVVLDADGREWAWNDVDLLPVARPGGAGALAAALKGMDAFAEKFRGDFRADLDFGRPIDETGISALPPVLLWIETARGHRVIRGDADLFTRNLGFDPRRPPAKVEAEKLLLNRGTGLLMAALKLSGRPVRAYDCLDADFVRRNAAKASLALGDALLIAAERYETPVEQRWNAFTRARRAIEGMVGWSSGADHDAIVREYRFGLDFKADPAAFPGDPEPARLSELARLWGLCFAAAERARTGGPWPGEAAFAASRAPVEPAEHRGAAKIARNLAHNARLGRPGLRYPRERLFRELPLLLAEVARGGLPDSARAEAFVKLWKSYN